MMTSMTVPVLRPGSGRAGATAPRWAAGAALVAAAVHLWAVSDHVDEGWPHLGFFAALTVAQLWLAVLLLRGARTRVLLAGVWGTMAVVAVYVLSRTTGVFGGIDARPAGPIGHGTHAGHLPVAGGWGDGVPVIPSPTASTQSVGVPDLIALGAEFALVGLLVAMLPPGARRSTTNVMLVLGVFVCALRATRVLG
jgi:hypothetical protein